MIFKEAEHNFLLKILAKFGDYKHNKDIKQNCGIEGGGGKILMEISITFNVFFIETFPNRLRNSCNCTFQ